MPSQLKPQLVHVAVDHLEEPLVAPKHLVERGLVSGEIRANELLECGRRAVLRPPEARDLPQPPLEARTLGFTVLLGQIIFQVD